MSSHKVLKKSLIKNTIMEQMKIEKYIFIDTWS